MEQAAPLAIGSVLVVDDDQRVRSALTRLIIAAHPTVRIESVGSAAAAEMAAVRSRPDVALIDIRLPGQESGLGLVRTLSGISGIPVVAISAFDGLRSAALVAGATLFLNKGSSAESVLTALRVAAEHAVPLPTRT